MKVDKCDEDGKGLLSNMLLECMLHDACVEFSSTHLSMSKWLVLCMTKHKINQLTIQHQHNLQISV